MPSWYSDYYRKKNVSFYNEHTKEIKGSTPVAPPSSPASRPKIGSNLYCGLLKSASGLIPVRADGRSPASRS